jgi:hypothetical protein
MQLLTWFVRGTACTLHIGELRPFQVPLPFSVRRSAFGVWRLAFGVPDRTRPRKGRPPLERCLACEAVVNREISLHNALDRAALYHSVVEGFCLQPQIATQHLASIQSVDY